MYKITILLPKICGSRAKGFFIKWRSWKMHNKHVLKFLFFAIIIFAMTGCKKKDMIMQEEGRTTVESIAMTKSEKEFLKDIYIDEDRIDKGFLYSYQEEALLQYRFVYKYLNEKYPNYSFEILKGEPTNAVNPYSRFLFKENSKDDVFEAHVMQENDNLQGEDNFYGNLIRQEYDDYIYSQCASNVSSLIGVYSIIKGVKGVGYDENLTVQDIIDRNKTISPLTEIYLSGSHIASEDEWGEMAGMIEKFIQNMELYGSYIVYYLPYDSGNDLNRENCHSYLENNGFLYKYSFQNFN